MEDSRDFFTKARLRLFYLLTSAGRVLAKGSVKKLILIGVVVFFVGLPFLAQTKAYPVAVVDGNSMVPTFHNGDLVFYTSSRAPVKAGSIIVFVQSDTGVSTLDAFTKPIIIHRVVSMGLEPDGTASYVTKGDNNQVPDPFVTAQGNVLGTPVLVVPFMGFPILFFKTAYGLLMIVSLVSLYFFSGVDTRFAAEEARKRFAAVFARHSLNGEISVSQFERLNKALQYGEEMPGDDVRDPMALSIINWVKTGAIDEEWNEELVECPTCSNQSFLVASHNADILICPTCDRILGDESLTTQIVLQDQAARPEQLAAPLDSGVGNMVQENIVSQSVASPAQESLKEIIEEPPQPEPSETVDDLTREIARLLEENLPMGQLNKQETEPKRAGKRPAKRTGESGWEYSPSHDG